MEEKEKHILRESLRIFMKFGVRSISMDDISRELGISKKTLYQYFENKTDLLDKALECNVEESNCLLAGVVNEDKNAIDILLDISKVVSQQMKEVQPSVVYELQKYYPEIFRKFMDQKREMTYNGIIRNIEKGIKDGLYRDELDKELIARLYVQRLRDVHEPEFLGTVQNSFPKIFLVMFENHIRGIANQKGLKYFEKEKEKIRGIIGE